ncbi:PilZ domain-containing protein [Geomonas sp. RF6]|uniref:PilZ domain-containing protein n=1 Tax=Geomonas sp. RF6 TaxID=2897342 RepID=UPI001E2E9D33|nr:PilZ domain-containing protein [Geomonas sp. RF6]UFS69075.1 PilZ domain-containing protein [Geomonas sp. RF6]
MDEKRSFSRVGFKVNALLQGEGVALKGEVKDLSLHGVFVETEGALPVGTDVELTVYLSAPPDPVVIKVTGSVVRSGEGGIGCTFDKIDLDSFAHLRRIISYQMGSDEQALSELAAYATQRGCND